MTAHTSVREKQSPPPLQFFLYVVTFVALFFVAMGTGSILFQFVNKAFPDAVSAAVEGIYSQEAVKFGIAAIFVALPIFLLLMRIILTQLRNGKIQTESRVRKWVTYIILFITAVIMIGDLIAVIFNFLNGDIAARFLLKMLTILLIAGSIFLYYFWDIRKKKTHNVLYPLDKIAGISVAAVVLCVFVSSFFIIDKPSVARAKRVDQQTVNDLRNVDSSIRGYYAQTGNLPDSLDGLSKTDYVPFVNKESQLEYRKAGDDTFELCGNFLRDNAGDFVPGQGIAENEWAHGQGRICFDRIALRSDSAPMKIPK